MRFVKKEKKKNLMNRVPLFIENKFPLFIENKFTLRTKAPKSVPQAVHFVTASSGT